MRSAGDEKHRSDDSYHYEKAFHDDLEKSLGTDGLQMPTDLKERDAGHLLKHLSSPSKVCVKGYRVRRIVGEMQEGCQET